MLGDVTNESDVRRVVDATVERFGRLDVLTNVLMGRLNHVGQARSLLKLWSAEDKAIALSALEQFDIASLAAQRADDGQVGRGRALEAWRRRQRVEFTTHAERQRRAQRAVRRQRAPAQARAMAHAGLLVDRRCSSARRRWQ